MITKENIKNSLRVDHSLDDELIQQIIETTEEYILTAIDSKANAEELKSLKQFDWAVSLLSQHWYLNRQESAKEHIPNTVLSLIQQMRGVHYATH